MQIGYMQAYLLVPILVVPILMVHASQIQRRKREPVFVHLSIWPFLL